MELNKLAGRTFNDLMQYPVFPFILSNYGGERLELKDGVSFRYRLGVGYLMYSRTSISRHLCPKQLTG